LKTALDIDLSELDAQETNFVENIKTHGWSATHVLADDEGPEFSYTTGFWYKFQFPELILFSLPNEVAHQIFWNLFNLLAEGGILLPNAPNSEALEGHDVFLRSVEPRWVSEFLTWTKWFYGQETFEVQQLVWPDKLGNFPWDNGAETAFKIMQPNLTNQVW
jgi:hypothetical protein